MPHTFIKGALFGKELQTPGSGLEIPMPKVTKCAPTAQVPAGVVYTAPLKKGGTLIVVAGNDPEQEPVGAT